MTSYDAVLAGVGGQGIVLTSRLLMEEAMLRRSEARGAETHGMAQRGGSVIAHLRLGPCHSPLVIPGTGHLLLAMERYEGLRNLRYLRPGGLLLVNAPDLEFADGAIRDYLERKKMRVHFLDATHMAVEAGRPLSVNMIMTGLAAAQTETPFGIEGLREAVSRVVRERFVEGSLEALDSGYRAGASDS